jgi:hypothetical protein
MGRDLTHAIRLRDLRADYERAGVTFDEEALDVPVTAGGTADYTGAEAARLLRDEDGHQVALQAETLNTERQA